MTDAVRRHDRPRLAKTLTGAALSLLLVLAATIAMVPQATLGASTTQAAACGARLRTSPNGTAPLKATIATDTKVTIATSVPGGRWTTVCAGRTVSGTSWYRISAINGRSVASLFGLTYLYSATGLYKPVPVTKYAACNLSLRTSASTTSAAKGYIKTATKVLVATSVTGAYWKATCAGRVLSGKVWYRISAVGASTAKALYGVTYVYAPLGLFMPTPTPVPPTPPASTGMYGPAVAMDGIGNTQVGGPNGAPTRQVSYRFRASTTAALSRIQFAQTDGAGYWGGDGGSLSITVQSDAAGNPSGIVLASASFTPRDVCCYWPVLTFSAPANLTAGRLYHIVFRNTDPDPATNYPSLNNLFLAANASPRIPKYADADWAELVRESSSSSWYNPRPDGSGAYIPSLGLYYANGLTAGVGYAYVGSTATISGAARVRETFTVTGADRSVSSVGLRLRSVSGSDPLTIRLETAGGSALDTITIPASALSAGGWTRATFHATHKLTKGASYNLQISTPASSRYTLKAIYQGSSYGAWAPATYFADGRAQTNGGAGWANWGGRSDEDIQFYLH